MRTLELDPSHRKKKAKASLAWCVCHARFWVYFQVSVYTAHEISADLRAEQERCRLRPDTERENGTATFLTVSTNF